jgi:tRNA-binding protein
MNVNAQAYCTMLKDLVRDDDPLVILSQTPSRIQTLIVRADTKSLSHKPSPGKWSIREILAHLADSELVFAYRLRTIFALDGAHLQAFDPDQWASTFDYGSCDAHTSAELFSALRMGTVRMLRTVDPTLLDNTGTHAEWGTETARSLVRLEAGHDRNHVAQIERILASVGTLPAFVPSEPKPEIPLDAANRVDLRVGTIIDIVEVAGASRLMKLTVDFGTETRTVIAGIRDERGDPRVLVGRQALFYYNLPKKTIRGQVSEAMLCDVGYADGILPGLLEPEWPVPNGTRAG